MANQRLRLSSLGQLVRLSAGGQGVVYRAPRASMPHATAMVFKEYNAANRAAINVAALEAFPSYLESLSFNDGMELLSRTAWPCRLVETDAGDFVGFVMPVIPAQFFIDMKKPSGAVTRETAEFQHLLNDDDFLARRGIALTDRHRYQLLVAVAEALSLLHRHNLVVGDFSPKNLLFSLTGQCAVYFIDCDAMRLKGGSVTPQLETPGWEIAAINRGEELATVATDSYKFGLLALRLWAGNQTTRDPNKVPSSLPRNVLDLTVAALSPDPAGRPKAWEWISALESAARAASTRPPQQTRHSTGAATSTGPRGPIQPTPAGVNPLSTRAVARPTPIPSAGRSPAPRTSRRRNTVLLTIAAVVGLVIIAVSAFNGGSPETDTRSNDSGSLKTTARQVATATPISTEAVNHQIQAMSTGQCWNGMWTWSAADDSYMVAGDVPAVVACDSTTATQRLEMVDDNCRGTTEWLNLTERAMIDGQAHCLVLVPQEAQCLPARLEGGRLNYSGIPIRCDSAASSRFPAVMQLNGRLHTDNETCNTDDGYYFIWWDLLGTGFCYNILQ